MKKVRVLILTMMLIFALFSVHPVKGDVLVDDDFNTLDTSIWEPSHTLRSDVYAQSGYLHLVSRAYGSGYASEEGWAQITYKNYIASSSNSKIDLHGVTLETNSRGHANYHVYIILDFYNDDNSCTGTITHTIDNPGTTVTVMVDADAGEVRIGDSTYDIPSGSTKYKFTLKVWTKAGAGCPVGGSLSLGAGPSPPPSSDYMIAHLKVDRIVILGTSPTAPPTVSDVAVSGLSAGDYITPDTQITLTYSLDDGGETPSTMEIDVQHNGDTSWDGYHSVKFVYDTSSGTWSITPSNMGWDISGDPTTGSVTITVGKYAVADDTGEWEFTVTATNSAGSGSGTSPQYKMSHYVSISSLNSTSLSFSVAPGSSSSTQSIAFNIDANNVGLIYGAVSGLPSSIEVYAGTSQTNMVKVGTTDTQIGQWSSIGQIAGDIYVYVTAGTGLEGTYTGTMTVKAQG